MPGRAGGPPAECQLSLPEEFITKAQTKLQSKAQIRNQRKKSEDTNEEGTKRERIPVAKSFLALSGK